MALNKKSIQKIFLLFLTITPLLSITGQNNSVPKMTEEELFRTIYEAENSQQTVSYTHLTLPTIYSV